MIKCFYLKEEKILSYFKNLENSDAYGVQEILMPHQMAATNFYESHISKII